MNSRLHDLYANVAVHATEDREHEAAIELLLFVMVVDHHISDSELDEIRQISADSGWVDHQFQLALTKAPLLSVPTHRSITNSAFGGGSGHR